MATLPASWENLGTRNPAGGPSRWQPSPARGLPQSDPDPATDHHLINKISLENSALAFETNKNWFAFFDKRTAIALTVAMA